MNERELIERYICVPNFNCRQYIVSRIIQLNESALGHYKWNNGGNFNNTAWNPSFPSDSQVFFELI
jgi:hypothetical protein